MSDTSDQEGGMASMVYAGKIIKDLGLEDEYTLLVTGTVQEEDCDGLCWHYIIDNVSILDLINGGEISGPIVIKGRYPVGKGYPPPADAKLHWR